jgi:hypothetical protein
VINIKKAASKSYKIAPPTKITKAIVPNRDIIISIKVIEPTKPTKAVTPAKAAAMENPNTSRFPTKPAAPVEVYPTHEIKQSKISIEEDIITNPHDYEKQSFSINLECPNGHFWRAGKPLPVSKGKAFCPKCGDPLKSKPKQKKPRPAGFNY